MSEKVQTSVFGPVLRDIMRERFLSMDDGARILEEKTGVPADRVLRIVNQGVNLIDFNEADDLLCAVGREDLWHRGSLALTYAELDA